MASLTATLLTTTLLLTACGGGGSPLAPGAEDPGTLPSFPMPTVPLEVPVADLVVEAGSEAGSVILRFTAPDEESGSPADAYRVLASVRHFDDTTLDRASAVPVAHAPGPPGTHEVVTVRGLAPDRTLVFGVQSLHDGQAAPLGLTASGRVAGRDVPAVPPGAILLDGPATLTANGATYVLTRDVTASGTAFEIRGRDVVLDLGGHTVTYGVGGGPAHGVLAAPPPGSGGTTIRNGRLVQGGAGERAHGVLARSVRDARVSYVAVDVRGPDTTGIWIADADGTVRVDHCDVACRTTTVTNRHYPGVAAILVEQATGAVEIDQNVITAAPQWGIRVEGRASSHPCLIHHNRVIGTKALVANGYMIGVHKPDADVFENELAGESRGIHVDEVDTSGRDAWIHDNVVEVQDQPNAEYPRHWVHGIKVEAASGCLVERNRVRGVADPTHAEVYGIDVTVGDARGITIRQNVVEAISRTPSLQARALNLSYGATGTRTDDVAVAWNLFSATDTLVHHEWDGGRGIACRGNWWTRDLSLGSGHAFRFEYFGNGTGVETRGQRFIDPQGDVDVLAVEQWASPGVYASTREWTLTVVATDAGTPVAGADVTVRTRTGAVALAGTTDAAGRLRGLVLGTQVERGPTFSTPNPHAVTVAKAGLGTWEGGVTVDRTTALLVDLRAREASADTVAPPPPPEVGAHALAASRAFVWWTAAEDVSSVSAYRVYLDGEPAAITTARGAFLGGLRPGRRYEATVVAVDGAGLASVPSRAVAFTTRPEDRGP